VTILIDYLIMQILIVDCLAGMVIGAVNLRRAVDRNAPAGREIEDRLKNLIATPHAITDPGDTKTHPWLKENKVKGGETD